MLLLLKPKNDLRTMEGARDYMAASTSKEDWNRRCLEVANANAGRDSAWYVRILIRQDLYRRTGLRMGWLT